MKGGFGDPQKMGEGGLSKTGAVMRPLRLDVLPGEFAICRLPGDAEAPSWIEGGPFSSVTRSQKELSIVTLASQVPKDVRADRGWRCLRIAGPMPLTSVGVLASIAAPLANASINLFAVSTFDTDYILVQSERLTEAEAALTAAGHLVASEMAR
jgi:hypothetical protein